MKKSDLEYGNVVEVRNGHKYIVYHDGYVKSLVSLITGWATDLGFYNENLIYSNNFMEFDIMKVYKDYTCKELLWERKEPKLAEDEKAILRNVPKDYKWIARDASGMVYIYTQRPEKLSCIWSGNSYGGIVIPFDHLFQFIKWEDDEPYSIEDLLKGE